MPKKAMSTNNATLQGETKNCQERIEENNNTAQHHRYKAYAHDERFTYQRMDTQQERSNDVRGEVSDRPRTF